MKVTLMTPGVAVAAGYLDVDNMPYGETYVVAAPDGVFYFNNFAEAKTFAHSYDLPVSAL